MGHLGHGRIGLVDGVQHRVAEEPGDQLVHPVVQRRRKQQPLAIIGRGGQNPGDAGQKAEIGHVIRLVDHGHPHRLQGDQTLPHQILEPAGAGHHDVHSGLQRGHLAVLRDAAEDRADPQASRRRQRLERRGDLRRQLPGGCQHQTRWPGGTAVSGGQPADERNRERERLAAAGFPAAQHISPGKGVGQGFGLDGERARDTARRQRIHDPGGHAEIGKSLGGGHFSVPFRQRRVGDEDVPRTGARWRDCRLAKSIAARQASAGCTDHPGAGRGLRRRHRWDEKLSTTGWRFMSVFMTVLVTVTPTLRPA